MSKSRMSSKKQQLEEKQNQESEYASVRVKRVLADALKPHCDDNLISFAEFVQATLLEKARELGYWPPKRDQSSTSE